MLLRLLLAGAVLFAIITVVRRTNSKPPADRRKYYFTLTVTVLAGALVLLALTGRVHWIGALIGALLPFVRQAFPLLIRMIPFIQHQRKASAAGQGASGGNTSEVETDWLQMRMDHDSNRLSGTVKQGSFAGKTLDSLSQEELQQLYLSCENDQDSINLLNAYFKYRFGDNWNQSQSNQSNAGSSMTRAQALAVLGLTEDADRDAIVKAHRSLMQKLHPDRGGNDYLASQINLAKDILLDE
ncbi:molecular chaperone DnaJ [Litorivivens sp.]|uniref:molecular chaperone DnaJ n=1 Tax=Litorivivens sp. TaxID=2020868 RepID=UPI00356A8621